MGRQMATATDKKSNMKYCKGGTILWMMILTVVASLAITGWFVMVKGWAPYEWLELSEFDRNGLRRIKISKVVMESGSLVEGLTIAEWTEKWWLWLLQIPNIHDTLRDNTGEKCQFGQNGPVWFIAGAYAQRDVARHCTIPQGRYILIPVINAFTRPRPLEQNDCTSERKRVETNLLSADEPYLILNGKEAPEVRVRHRETTGECFDSGTGRALSASDGYWIMLRPLPEGEYKLEFGLRDPKANRAAVKKVAYSLTIAPANTDVAKYEPWPVLPDVAPGSETVVSMPLTPLFDGGHVMRRIAGILAREGMYVLVDGSPAPAGSVNSFQFAPRDLAIIERGAPDIAEHMPVPFSIWLAPPERENARLVVSAVSEEEGPSLEWRKKSNADLRRILKTALDKTEIVTDEDITRFTQMHHYRWSEFVGYRSAFRLPANTSRQLR